MNRLLFPLLMSAALAGPAAAQGVLGGAPLPGVPTRDILMGTLDPGRAPMAGVCDQLRDRHSDRVLRTARRDQSVAGRTLLVVDATQSAVAAMRDAGFTVEDLGGDRDPGCTIVRVRLDRDSTLREIDGLLAKIAPGAAWVSEPQ